MINLFRKKDANSQSQGRISKYLTYAVGEILLVMIGILLAVQVNNWNEKRIAAKIERINFQELANNLNQDIEDLQYNLIDDTRTLNSINAILGHLGESEIFHDSLANHFGVAFRYTNFINNTSAYESLKSIGLNSIQDSKLRFDLISYYEDECNILVIVEKEFINNAENIFMKPMKVKYFNFDSADGPAYPRDFETLLTEGNIKQVLIELKGDFEWKIELTENCLEKAQKLINQIKDKFGSTVG